MATHCFLISREGEHISSAGNAFWSGGNGLIDDTDFKEEALGALFEVARDILNLEDLSAEQASKLAAIHSVKVVDREDPKDFRVFPIQEIFAYTSSPEKMRMHCLRNGNMADVAKKIAAAFPQIQQGPR